MKFVRLNLTSNNFGGRSMSDQPSLQHLKQEVARLEALADSKKGELEGIRNRLNSLRFAIGWMEEDGLKNY